MLIGKKNKYIQLIPFILFFILLFYLTSQSHYMGDDVRYMLRSSFNQELPFEKVSSLYQAIESTVHDFMKWNSRFFYTFGIIDVLRYPLIVWRILNSLFITLSIYFGMRMIRNKEFIGINDLIINSLVLWSFFSLSYMHLDECVFWITGSVFYSWALFTTIIMLNAFLTERKKDEWYHYLIYGLFALLAGCTIENLSVSISVMLLFYLIFQKFIHKKYTKLHLSTSIIFWLTNIIQLLSPGVRVRDDNISMSLFNRIYFGLVNFSHNQFIDTGILIIFFLTFLLINIKKHNKYLFYLGSLFSLPLITIRLAINTIPSAYNAIVGNPYGSYLVDGNNAFYIIPGQNQYKLVVLAYYLILTLLCALSIIEIYRKEKDYYYFFILILTTICNLATWVSGIGSFRTSYFSQFFFMIGLGALLYKNFKDLNKPIKIGLIFLMLHYLGVVAYLGNYNHNIKVAKIREEICNEIINSGIKEKDLSLPRFKDSVHGNFEDPNSWEYQYFGRYYLGLDDFTISFYDLD